jgi:hypothetical protein
MPLFRRILSIKRRRASSRSTRRKRRLPSRQAFLYQVTLRAVDDAFESHVRALVGALARLSQVADGAGRCPRRLPFVSTRSTPSSTGRAASGLKRQALPNSSHRRGLELGPLKQLGSVPHMLGVKLVDQLHEEMLNCSEPVVALSA